MELSKYIKKHVKIDLKNGFYYKGFVTFADNTSISLIDINNNAIDISEDQISFIREIDK